jgi:hypothetical protein
MHAFFQIKGMPMNESRTTLSTQEAHEFQWPSSLAELGYICAYALSPYLLAGILLAA